MGCGIGGNRDLTTMSQLEDSEWGTRSVSNTYLLTLLMVTPYPHRAPITPFVEPIAPFWIVMTCMTHRDVAGLLCPAIRYRPATGL